MNLEDMEMVIVSHNDPQEEKEGRNQIRVCLFPSHPLDIIKSTHRAFSIDTMISIDGGEWETGYLINHHCSFRLKRDPISLYKEKHDQSQVKNSINK